MKYAGLCVGMVLLAVVLSGCPYEAKVALGVPERNSIDSTFIGYWVWDDPEGKEESVLLDVRPFNDAEYIIIFSSADEAPDRFRAFRLSVGGRMFWNINRIEKSFPPDDYTFARSTFTDDTTLSMTFVGKGVPTALKSDAEGLRKYIGSHLDDSTLYDSDGAYVYRRPGPGEVANGRLRAWKK